MTTFYVRIANDMNTLRKWMENHKKKRKRKESKNKKAMKHWQKERGKSDSVLRGGVEEGTRTENRRFYDRR